MTNQNPNPAKIYFITGIDTDAGKSYATGLLWRYLCQQGYRAITQKLVQTGCDKKIADDILTHRRFIPDALLPTESEQLISPCILQYPASPHLAAELEEKMINTAVIEQATVQLAARYQYILLEGAGGINVPLQRQLLISDWLMQRGYATIIVSSGKLGSINHTLLTLEVLVKRHIPVAGIIYNHYPVADARIGRDSRAVFVEYLRKFNLPPVLIEIPLIENWHSLPEIDFSPLFFRY